MELKKVYFIKKDFIGFPLDVLAAYYDDDGDLVVNNSLIQQVPRTLNLLKKSKLKHFTSLSDILNYRMCSCNKRMCTINEELYKIVNNKLNQI